MPKLSIDGRSVEVDPGATILEAARKLGIDVPTLCHLEGRCPARRCRELLTYSVADHCTGCTLCAQRCPADAIPFTPYQVHRIDMDRCTRCDTCRAVCPEDAVEVR